MSLVISHRDSRAATRGTTPSTRPQVRRRIRLLALATATAGVAAAPAARAAVITKSNTSTALNLSGSWVGGVVPGAADVALWNVTVTGANTTVLGANLSWDGLRVLNPGGAVTINSDGNTLTLGATGIDLSAATQSLTLNNALALGAGQGWTVASGQSLTANGGINNAGNELALRGSGSAVISGVVTGAGGLTRSDGTGTATLSAANTYAGATNVYGGTLALNFAAAGAPAANIIASASPLTLGGGTLSIAGGAGAVSQDFAGISLGGADSTLAVTSAANGVTVNLGTITRGNRGTVSFVAPAAGTTSFTTTTGSTAPFGILNYATFGDSDYAAVNSGSIVAGATVANFYLDNPIGTDITLSAARNYDMKTSGWARIAHSQAANALRFNTNIVTTTGSSTGQPTGGTATYSTDEFQIKSGFTLSVNSILVTPNVGAGSAPSNAGSGVYIGGGGNIQMQAGGELLLIQNNTASNMVLNANVVAATSLVKSGPGTVLLTGTNTYTGTTTVNGGILSASSNARLGAPVGGAAITLQGGTLQATGTYGLFNGSAGAGDRAVILNARGAGSGGTIDVTASNALTVSGVVSGSGTLYKTNTGTLVLAGQNTYTGGTSVVGGALKVANGVIGSATGTGAVSVAGGTLTGSGTLAGDLTLNSGGHLAPGDAGVGTIAANSVVFNAGSVLDFELGAGNDLLSLLAGGTVNPGTAVNLYQAGSTNPFTATGNYTLVTTTSGTIAGNVPVNLTVANPQSGTTYSFAVSGGNSIVVSIAGTSVSGTWANPAGGTWGLAGNWTGGIPAAALDIANFTIATAAPVTLDANRIVGSVVFNSSTPYTIAAGSSASNTLTFNGGGGNASLNDISGSHTISAPVSFDTAVTATVNASGDVLTLAGAAGGTGAITKAGAGTLVFAGNNTATGNLTINAGVVQVGSAAVNAGTTGNLGSGAVTNNAAIQFNRAGAVVIPNAISGTGTVTLAGAGTVQLAGTNTYAGSTTVSSGTLQVGSAAPTGTGAVTVAGGAMLDLNGLSPTIGTLAGGGTVDNVSAGGPVVLTVGGAGATTFSGVIQNTTGTVGLSKTGTGALTLAGVNTYAGATTVNAGSIIVPASNTLATTSALNVNVNNGISLGSGVTLANPINIGGGIASAFADVATGTATLSGTVTRTGSSQYRVGTSGGTLVITGLQTGLNANNFVEKGRVTYDGNAVLDAGVERLSFGRSTAALTVTIQGNASLKSGTADVGGAAANANEAVTINFPNTSPANTASLTVAGNFDVNNINAAGTSTINLDGATLQVGAFTKTRVAGNQTATINFNGGTLKAGAATASFLPALVGLSTNVLAGGAVVDTNTFDVTIGATLASGAGTDGGLTKRGAGTLTIPVQNTYNGITRAEGGTLKFTVGQNLAGTISAGPGGTVSGENVDLFAGGVSITGGPAAPTGKIDLKAGNLVVTYGTGGSTRPNVEQLVAFGALNANSAGIVTSTGTPGGLTLGVADTADVGGITLYNSGATIPANSVVVRYTYAGDATLDGSVDTADLGVMLDNFGALADPGGRQWSIGDVNYDASVDTADLGLALDNFGQLAGSGAVQAALAGLGFTLADGVETGVANGQSIRFALTGAALPEPASLGLLGVGAMALLGRRRRRA